MTKDAKGHGSNGKRSGFGAAAPARGTYVAQQGREKAKGAPTLKMMKAKIAEARKGKK